MTELSYAILLADKVLDRVSADPDDDLAVLARQFIRAQEQLANAYRTIDDQRVQFYDEIRRSKTDPLYGLSGDFFFVLAERRFRVSVSQRQMQLVEAVGNVDHLAMQVSAEEYLGIKR